MKPLCTFLYRFLCVMIFIAPVKVYSQISLNICNDPTNIIYGLTQTGTIYPINVNTAATGAVVKNSTYPGNPPGASNAMGYNSANNRFYYFKRNVLTSAPQEFVSFNPVTGIVTLLASSGTISETHTGCISVTGNGYYAIDIAGSLHYYNIAANTWTRITTSIVDDYGASVTNVITNGTPAPDDGQIAGDLIIDGWGNLWIVTSSDVNYGVYRVQAPLPTTPVASITARRIVAPTATTPTGTMIAGIAFNPTGQILVSTKYDDRLYVLENNLSMTYKGTFPVVDVGNDLTSCNFPLYVLPVEWRKFDAKLSRDNQVDLSWTVVEENNNGFYVEYSEDGNTWTDLTFIEGRNIIDKEQSFSFTHINNNNGRVYYRIRQQDKSGKESHSAVKSVVLKNTGAEISIWPNPISSTISIDNRGSLFTTARIYDMTGKELMKATLSAGVNSFNTEMIERGIYILTLSGRDQTYTQKIVKQ